MTLEGDFETQKQHKCWTGQKKQFVALKGKSQNKLSKLSNVDEKLWMEKSRISFFVKSGLKVEICLKVFQWDYRKHCRLAAAESLAISSNVVCSSLVKSWKTKSPLHTHHCNLSPPPFTCDCCNYVNFSLILVIVSGITSFGHYFSSSHIRFLQYFSLDIVHYRHHLDTDAFHHVQLPSAVQVQNGLKLAGGPAVWEHRA